MNDIAQEMEIEMETRKQTLSKDPEGFATGGLYKGIEEVGSNVTFTQDETKIVGKRSSFDGRLSMKDYETLSAAENRRSQYDKTSSAWNRNHDVLSVGTADRNDKFIAIEEKEGLQEEASFEAIEFSQTSKPVNRFRELGSQRKRLGRVLKAPGTESQIQDMMFKTTHNVMTTTSKDANLTQSTGFVQLKQ